jgi:NAD(P)-dependent dehydrogenase (short-subunit alcohol dehydrogenase family)
MTDKAKTVVITGASSGIGKATAQWFAGKGWNVIATMRKPAAEKDLIETANLKLVRLDVQDSASVKAAVETALAAFGTIDVWVNNAGYGAFGPIEAASRARVQRQYDVNVFGLIECVQAIAPHFRAQRAGVLINVTSVGGLVASPGYGIYNSSKFAAEGLSEALWYELGAFGIKVKLVEPGVTRTAFGGRSMDILDFSNLPDYTPLMKKMDAARARFTKNQATPEFVAATIFDAANDRSDRLRYVVGADATRLWHLRNWLGSRMQMRLVRNLLKI